MRAGPRCASAPHCSRGAGAPWFSRAALAPLDTRLGKAVAALVLWPWLQHRLLFLPPGSDPTVPGGH